MFDGLQDVEIAVQKPRAARSAKANRGVTERLLLVVMATTMAVSTIALLGILAVSA
jgi:hypothetical protein